MPAVVPRLRCLEKMDVIEGLRSRCFLETQTAFLEWCFGQYAKVLEGDGFRKKVTTAKR